MFFYKGSSADEYENYYNKLINHDNYKGYLDGVNLNIEEIDNGDSRYSYIITFDGASDYQGDVKILVLDENCNKEEIEQFPSFGIIANQGYSLVKKGMENEKEKKLKGVNLTIVDSEKIDSFLIYFGSNSNEQFAKVKVVK